MSLFNFKQPKLLMNINYIYKHSRLFIFSPIFPVLLGLIIFIIYIIYFTPVILCDDNDLVLYSLKTELTSEITRYKTAILKMEHYTSLREQLQSVSRPNFRNFSLEESYASNLRY
jgi:hypothetical protein